MLKLTDSPAYRALAAEHQRCAELQLNDLFAQDPGRFEAFSLELGDLLFDFSKQRVTRETLSRLIALAEERGVRAAFDAMFSGQPINFTEGRSVLHVALRNRSNA